jgi:hypothetical protein
VGGHGDMLFLSSGVGKAEIDEFRVGVFYQGENVCSAHWGSSV